jgi:hypothetical protein
MINHGTDHGFEGQGRADSPLYARLGYSTATVPVLDDSGWTTPVDQSVVLIDRDGNTTHRTGMRTLVVREDGDVGLAGSAGPAHWVRTDDSGPDHGEGRAGTARPAGRITVYSLVRGPYEVRLARAGEVDAAAVRLRVGGWPVAGNGPESVAGAGATVTGAGLTSYLRAILPSGGIAGISAHDDAGPLRGPVRVPWIDHPVEPDAWTATLVALAGDLPETPHIHVEIAADVRVTWPDGVTTRHHLTVPPQR